MLPAAIITAAASQPAPAAAPPRSSPVKFWPPTLAPYRAQFIKAGFASARMGAVNNLSSKAQQTAR